MCRLLSNIGFRRPSLSIIKDSPPATCGEQVELSQKEIISRVYIVTRALMQNAFSRNTKVRMVLFSCRSPVSVYIKFKLGEKKLPKIDFKTIIGSFY
jgi:hypothetical protein